MAAAESEAPPRPAWRTQAAVFERLRLSFGAEISPPLQLLQPGPAAPLGAAVPGTQRSEHARQEHRPASARRGRSIMSYHGIA